MYLEDIIFKELTNHELTEAEKINLEFWLNENAFVCELTNFCLTLENIDSALPINYY